MPRFAPVTTATVSLDHQALRAEARPGQARCQATGVAPQHALRRDPRTGMRARWTWTREEERDRVAEVTRPEATPWCSSSPSSWRRGRRRWACWERGWEAVRSRETGGIYTDIVGCWRPPSQMAGGSGCNRRLLQTGVLSAGTQELGLGSSIGPVDPEHTSCTCPAAARSCLLRPPGGCTIDYSTAQLVPGGILVYGVPRES